MNVQRSTCALIAVSLLTTLGMVTPSGRSAASTRREESGGHGVVPAVRVAKQHVARNVRALGVLPRDVRDLHVTDAYRSSANGVTHVYLEQRVNGRPVEGAAATVNVLPTGEVLHVASHLVREVRKATSGRLRVDASVATATAAEHLGRGRGRGVAVSVPARLAYVSGDGAGYRLAWRVMLEKNGGDQRWEVAVDAATGRVLRVTDYVIHERFEGATGSGHTETQPARTVIRSPRSAEDGASYEVYAMPLESPNDGDRSVVKNPADAVASPYGWHDTDGKPGPEHTTTRGNNVHAYIDWVPAGGTPAPVMEAEGGENLAFEFSLDPSLPPYAWKDAAIANLFYWSNVIHDVTYRYGFDEAAGNFQTTNYSGKGEGEDAVRAEAQDGSGTDNANFSITPDGVSSRIQMYVWTRQMSEGSLVDGDLDSGVIVHEYGHGISTRLTGGPSRADCLFNAEQGGEGWSDWFALALTTRKADLGQPRGIGTYVLGQNSRTETGIRPTPYSTDTKVNPSTYNTIKKSAVPHGVGYVWATMLWDVYESLVDEYGFNPNVYDNWRSGGNNLAVQLVMDGLKMQPCEPGFVDARDAILAADRALTGGKNRCLLWRAFAKRGLGVAAKQGDSEDVSDGRESKAVPKGC